MMTIIKWLIALLYAYPIWLQRNLVNPKMMTPRSHSSPGSPNVLTASVLDTPTQNVLTSKVSHKPMFVTFFFRCLSITDWIAHSYMIGQTLKHVSVMWEASSQTPKMSARNPNRRVKNPTLRASSWQASFSQSRTISFAQSRPISLTQSWTITFARPPSTQRRRWSLVQDGVLHASHVK